MTDAEGVFGAECAGVLFVPDLDSASQFDGSVIHVSHRNAKSSTGEIRDVFVPDETGQPVADLRAWLIDAHGRQEFIVAASISWLSINVLRASVCSVFAPHSFI